MSRWYRVCSVLFCATPQRRQLACEFSADHRHTGGENPAFHTKFHEVLVAERLSVGLRTNGSADAAFDQNAGLAYCGYCGFVLSQRHDTANADTDVIGDMIFLAEQQPLRRAPSGIRNYYAMGGVFNTADHGAATAIWCATSSQLIRYGAVCCEEVDITQVSDADDAKDAGVKGCAIDPRASQKLWRSREHLTGLRLE